MSIKETVPFSYDEIYESVKNKLEAQGYDTIYEGSNTAQLVTAMSYMISMLNVNTAVNVNETILTLANKRNNILTDARVLGYEIDHIRSYVYDVTLEFGEGTHTITKYTKFTSGDKFYYYMNEDITFTVGAGLTEQKTISVKEGVLKTFVDNPDVLKITTTNILNEDNEYVPQHYVDIAIENVENDGIEVFLTYYDDFGALIEQEPWYKSNKFMIDKDTTLDREYVRLDSIEYKMPRLYFKLADVGDGLKLGTVVEMNALVSSGEDGAITSTLTTTLDCTVVSTYLRLQGASEESSESIKSNAPLFHNSANRAVTKSDYVAICTRQSEVRVAEVWDGNDEYPRIAGHIWFSFLPSSLVRGFTPTDEYKNEFQLDDAEDLENWYLEEADISGTDGVWDTLEEYSIPTLIYHNRHPLYIDFNYTIEIVKYIIATSKADIHQNVFDVINNYFISTDCVKVFEKFDQEYFHSNLIKRVDTDLTDITGFNNSLVTNVVLNEKTLVREDESNEDNIDIIIPLGSPFEDYFDGDDLDYTVLPNIDTELFDGTNDLSTDWSGLVGNEINEELIIAPIYLGATEVGEYRLFNSEKQDIEIRLYVNGGSGTGVYSTTSLTATTFDTTRYMSLQYKSPNFKLIKNCVPRLRNVTFI